MGNFSVKAVCSELHCNFYLVLYLFAVFSEFHIYTHIYIFPLSLSHVKSSSRNLLVTAQIWMLMKWVTTVCTACAQHQHSLIGYRKCAICHNLPKHRSLITSCCNEFQANMSNYAISFNKVTASTYSTLVNICTGVGLLVFVMSCSSIERLLEHEEFFQDLLWHVWTFVHMLSVEIQNHSAPPFLYTWKLQLHLSIIWMRPVHFCPWDPLQSHLVFPK